VKSWGGRVPPGSRTSTYTSLPEYEAISKSYRSADLEVDSRFDPNKPTVQRFRTPGCSSSGFRSSRISGRGVSQQISAAIAGRSPLDDALNQAQEYAVVVGKSYQGTRYNHKHVRSRICRRGRRARCENHAKQDVA